jgi:NTE family protein
MVPTRGLYLSGRLRRVFSSADFDTAEGPVTLQEPERFWQGEVEGTRFWRAREQDRFFVRFGGGTSFDSEPVIGNFALGGPFRLGALGQDEARGAHYLLGVAGYLKRTGSMAFGGGDVLLGGWIEQGSAWNDWDDAEYHASLSAGAILESLIGPVFLGVSADLDGRFRYYVALGPLFR